MLRSVAVAANEATEIEPAFWAAIEQVCETIGWPIGYAFLIDAPGPGARSADHFWHCTDAPACEEFRRESENGTFIRAWPFVGQVLETRRAVWLDDVGLGSALADYAARWSGQTAVSVDLRAEALDVERLDAAIKKALYRVVQEALTNVARHAAASHVYVTVHRRGGEVHALVEDDGRGFDPATIPRSPGEHRRLGLLGMEEQIAVVAGTLTVESSP